jgi:hypothetical protein
MFLNLKSMNLSENRRSSCTVRYAKRIWKTYIIHNACPSFHRDALEDCQHRQPEVVEVGDAAVGTDPVSITDPTAVRLTFVTLAARSRVVRGKRIWKCETSLHQHTHVPIHGDARHTVKADQRSNNSS